MSWPKIMEHDGPPLIRSAPLIPAAITGPAAAENLDVHQAEDWVRRNVLAGATLLCAPRWWELAGRLRDCSIADSVAIVRRGIKMAADSDTTHGNRGSLQIAGVVSLYRAWDVLISHFDEIRVRVEGLLDAGIDVLIVENLDEIDATLDILSDIVLAVADRKVSLVVGASVYHGGFVPSGETIQEAADKLACEGIDCIGIEDRRTGFDREHILKYLDRNRDRATALFSDVVVAPENLWLRSESTSASVAELYRSAIQFNHCRIIGGGRSAALDDVARYSAIVRSMHGEREEHAAE